MTTTNGGPTPPPQQQAPSLNVLGQYIKDFSFENPNAPRSLAPAENQPAINIAINVGVQQLGQSEYEVSLKLEGKAENSGTVLFAFDLTFAGMFRLQNVPRRRRREQHSACRVGKGARTALPNGKCYRAPCPPLRLPSQKNGGHGAR